MKRIMKTLILVLTVLSLMCSFSFSAYADDGGVNPPPEVDVDDSEAENPPPEVDFWDDFVFGTPLEKFKYATQFAEDFYDEHFGDDGGGGHGGGGSNRGTEGDEYKPDVSSQWKDDDGDGKYDSFTVPENYDIYGKRTLKYPDGSHELFTIHFVYKTPTKDNAQSTVGPQQPFAGNYIELTRQNSAGAKISKKLTITKLNSIYYYSNYFYFSVNFRTPDNKTYSSCHFNFTGSAVNDISLDADTVPTEDNWIRDYYNPLDDKHSTSTSIMQYVISIGSTNNSDFYAKVSNIYSLNFYGVCPILIGNIYSGTLIDMNNYMQFGDLGFSFNPDVGLSFDPDIYFDKYYKNFSTDIENLFKKIYSKMPEIGDTFVNSSSETTYNYFDVFQPEEQPPATTPSGGGGGDVNVNVDVSLPAEWLDSYPELDTTPAIDLDKPDYEYFKDNSLTGAPQATSTFLEMAVDFIVDNGFLPYLCAIVLLVIFWRLTGGS